MSSLCKRTIVSPLWILTTIAVLGAGCQSQPLVPVDSQIPRELSKVSLPAYVIEPPDILVINAVRTVPLPPYRIEPLDVLQIQVTGLPPDSAAIDGVTSVEAGGTVNLGAEYGTIRLEGMMLTEAKAAIETYLKDRLNVKMPPKALVNLVQSRALQQISGEHLVKQDGIINLGTYGSVYITGMTVPEARAAIEEHLSRFMLKPQISLDVLAYNSKVFYIITDGAGYGQQVVRLPITGNDTVLDALSQINGLPAQASKRNIWVARPAPAHNCGEGHDQILPVDWQKITECGQTATNYQLLPGDRIYVRADPLITFDNTLAKIINPMERLFGVTILGNAMVRNVSGKNGANSSSGGGF
jgi:polysaccharide biosynthesis/export protein